MLLPFGQCYDMVVASAGSLMARGTHGIAQTATTLTLDQKEQHTFSSGEQQPTTTTTAPHSLSSVGSPTINKTLASSPSPDEPVGRTQVHARPPHVFQYGDVVLVRDRKDATRVQLAGPLKPNGTCLCVYAYMGLLMGKERGASIILLIVPMML